MISGKLSKKALNEEQQRQVLEQNIDSLRQTLEPIDIDLLTRRGKTIANLQEKAQKLGIDENLIKEVDIRNLNTALQLVEGYDFEKAIGRSLTEQEQKILMENLIGNACLGVKNTRYIATLVKKLETKGMSREEAYGAVINYAIGNGNYSDALRQSK